MAKYSNPDMLDVSLNWLKGAAITTLGANRMTVCSTQPTTYAQATDTPGSSGYRLADVDIDSSNFTGPSPGDAGGQSRKIQVNQQADVPVDYTGEAAHVCLVNTTSQVLMYITTCTPQQLTQGNTVTIPAWTIEIDDNTPPA